MRSSTPSSVSVVPWLSRIWISGLPPPCHRLSCARAGGVLANGQAQPGVVLLAEQMHPIGAADEEEVEELLVQLGAVLGKAALHRVGQGGVRARYAGQDIQSELVALRVRQGAREPLHGGGRVRRIEGIQGLQQHESGLQRALPVQLAEVPVDLGGGLGVALHDQMLDEGVLPCVRILAVDDGDQGGEHLALLARRGTQGGGDRLAQQGGEPVVPCPGGQQIRLVVERVAELGLHGLGLHGDERQMIDAVDIRVVAL